MLRPYQEQALSEIRTHFRNGIKKVLLVMPTAAGKTTVFCEVMKGAALKGKRSLMVVSGRKLVDQASARLEREGVSHGVIMGNDPRRDDDELTQCASIDTLRARKLCPRADIIIIDEAHLANTPAFRWLIESLPDAYIIAVTATPFHREGFHSMAEVIVEPVTAQDLLDQGFLTPFRYFVPDVPDLSTVKRSRDDYVQKDVSKVMNQSRLFGRVVSNWITRGENRDTFMFATSVSHSLRLVKAFQDAGVNAMHIDAKTPKKDREDAFTKLSEGKIRIISSVGLLLCGVDYPPLGCIIVCRPTLSYNIHIQCLGRAARIHPGKRDALIFDHAGNVVRHGAFATHRHAQLDGKVPLFRVVVQTCRVCFCAWNPAESKTCPGILPDGEVCGEPIPPPEIKLSSIRINEAIDLVEADDIEARERRNWIAQTIMDAATAGKKKGYAFYQIKSRYGSEAANGAWRMIHEAFQ